jgi:lysophospholipase L1-like esterase
MRYEVTVQGVMAEGSNLGASGPGTIEVTSAGDAQLSAIRAWDEGDSLFLDEDYSRAGARTPVWMGPLLGGVVGLLFGLAARGPRGAVLAGLALLPALGVLSLSHHDQVGLVERFYLPVKAWELAPRLLLASFLPLVAAAALGSGALVVGRRDRRRLYWWAPGLLALAAAALGSRTLGGFELLWAVGGAVVLLMPTLLGFRARLPAAWVLVADLPALAAVAWFGWLALLPALLWRLLPVFASLDELVSKAKGPTAEHLFLTLLLLPVGAEVSLRSGLGDAWSGLGETRLELGELDPFWSGSCGDGATSVVFGGGSSTGGAYQFPDEPDAFYPSRAHNRLCEGRGLTTWNYGHGGRNTHVLADGIDRVMEHTSADLVVLYVGVNDLLTQHSALTRRERDARRGGAALGRYSRLVTGLGLAFRAPEATEGDRVADVPLADAEDNLRQIADAALDGDARVVLVAQYIAPSIEGDVAAYWAMEERLAEELDHVYFVDPRPEVSQAPEPLLDTNHLSRSGNNALGEALAEALEPLL